MGSDFQESSSQKYFSLFETHRKEKIFENSATETGMNDIAFSAAVCPFLLIKVKDTLFIHWKFLCFLLYLPKKKLSRMCEREKSKGNLLR